MQMQKEQRKRKAPVRFQAPVAIVNVKKPRSPGQVKQAEDIMAANAINRQEAIEESDQAASRLGKEGGHGKKNGLEWDFEDHNIIGMNGAAAGSQRRTKFLHARFGDGITLMVDMVPKQVGGGQGGLGNKALNAAHLKVMIFFRAGQGISARNA